MTSKSEKKRILVYLIFLIFGTALEGVAFYSFSILVKSKLLNDINVFQPFYIINNEFDLSLFVIIAIIARTIISAWSLKEISKTIVNSQSRYAGIYLENLVKNSVGDQKLSPSEISRSIETSTSYIFSAMQSLVLIFGEIFSVSWLIFVAFKLANLNFLIALAPMFLVLLLLSKTLKPRFSRQANTLSVEAQNYVKDALEASSLSQVVFGEDRLKYLVDRFKSSRNRSGVAYSKVIFMQQLPRYILETTTILMLVLAFVLSSDHIIASLTLIAPLLLRILPSFIKLSNLQFDLVKGVPFLDKMNREIEQFQKSTFHSNYSYMNSEENSIRCVAVQPNIGNYYLNEPISFEVAQGEILGIIGASGAGKTSLIECLIKKRNFKGDILISGKNVDSNEYSFAYVPQHSVFLNDSILSNLVLGKRITDSEIRARHILSLVGLPAFANNLDLVIDDHGATGIRLSGGERARLSFARALLADSEFLILDEITAGLDDQVENQILKTIQSVKTNKIIILITHRANVKEICNKIVTVQKEN